MTGVRAKSGVDWAFVDQLRKFWRGTLIIKGITPTKTKAASSMASTASCSNHGGRATETLRSTLESLPEVVAEVGNRSRSS
jgi:isopentenyl diphosphate isomerase/L-lactate dehydrogenase-like FMN-dependent dehydrogenase